MILISRYITKGIQNKIPLSLIIIIWELIDRLEAITITDYLHVFTLSSEDGVQTITHSQENPKLYCKTYKIPMNMPVNEKIYVIYDGNNQTMMLSEEY